MFHNFPFPIGFLGSVHTASSRKATPRCFAQSRVPCRFQSTPSSRRATAHIAVPAAGLLISIHALLTEGTPQAQEIIMYFVISIHALLTEGDNQQKTGGLHNFDFNPRPPHGGRRFSPHPRRRRVRFQSTPSSRRATFPFWTISYACTIFQSTPSSRRATPKGLCVYWDFGISIHALLTEGDPETSLKFT